MSETDLKNATDPASGQSEVENSGDSDLASLLSEYEEGTQPKAVTAPTPDLSKLAPVIKFAEQAMAASQKETFEKDVNSAVDTLSEDEAFKALPKTITRRMLIGYSFDNPNFDKAFEQRSQNPRIWDAALKEARSALAEEVRAYLLPALTVTTSRQQRQRLRTGTLYSPILGRLRLKWRKCQMSSGLTLSQKSYPARHRNPELNHASHNDHGDCWSR